jgi:hypothetical protein
MKFGNASRLDRKSGVRWGELGHPSFLRWGCPALVALQAQIAVLEDCDSCGKEQRCTQDDQDETAGV